MVQDEAMVGREDDPEYADALVEMFHANNASDDYDEELSDNLVEEISTKFPDTYEQLKEDTGYNDIIGQ